MQDYTNLSDKSKELKEYRRVYAKKKIQEHAFEIRLYLSFVLPTVVTIIVGCCLHKDFTTICTYCAFMSLFVMMIRLFAELILTSVEIHKKNTSFATFPRRIRTKRNYFTCRLC